MKGKILKISKDQFREEECSYENIDFYGKVLLNANDYLNDLFETGICFNSFYIPDNFDVLDDYFLIVDEIKNRENKTFYVCYNNLRFFLINSIVFANN
jgi:hypothetical protein